jgi:hypothetical protein
MAPSAITEDYYMILEVDPNAGLELIVRSYKRLALKLHPDRNSERNATEAFQQVRQRKIQVDRFVDHCMTADSRKLGRAYETLKDESERREYDLIYPFLKGKAASSQLTREPKTTSEPVSTASETAQIAVLRSFKQERATRWWTSMIMFDASISDAERAIRRLEQEINGLASIAAAEAAVEAKRNSWSTWLLSPLYTKAEDSEEVKAEKDRARQERRIERDMKERRVEAERAKLKATKADMEKSKTEIDDANVRDNMKIQQLLTIIQRKEAWHRKEKEKAEREQRAREVRQQQEQQQRKEREAAEARRQQQAAELLAKQRQEEEEARKWRKIVEELRKQQEEPRRQHMHSTFTSPAKGEAHQHGSVDCRHDGWWPKVQGRAACPKCHDSWTYLLQCPGCAVKACPKCQAAVRPRRQRITAKTDGRAHPSMRASSPDFGNDDYYW